MYTAREDPPDYDGSTVEKPHILLISLETIRRDHFRIPPESLGPGTVMREFYDLRADPKEGRNLLPEGKTEEVALAGELERRLDAWVHRTTAVRPAGAAGRSGEGDG